MGLKSSGVFANENRIYLAVPEDTIDVDIDESRIGEKLSDDRSVLLSYFAGIAHAFTPSSSFVISRRLCFISYR
jgi:hypothetical protein